MKRRMTRMNADRKKIAKIPLYDRIRQILESARTTVSRSVNTTQVVANWLVGREIVEEEQKGKERAAYGKRLVETLSVQITKDFGPGYSVQNLFYFKQFYLAYSHLLQSDEILHAVRGELSCGESIAKLHAVRGESGSAGIPTETAVCRARVDALRQVSDAARAELATEIGYAARSQSWKPGQLHSSLSWTHYRALLRVDKPEARAFYEIEAIMNNWGARELERQICSLLYERLALSRDKKGLMRLATKGHVVQKPMTPVNGQSRIFCKLEQYGLGQGRPWLLALLLAVVLPAGAGADWLADGEASPIRVFTGAADQQAKDDDVDRRGKVTIRRISPQGFSDWNNDPTALPYLFYQMDRRMQGKFPIYTDNSGLKLTGTEMFDYPIIYFTSHYNFTFTDEEVENLQRFLAQGGTLWLDDCTGSGPFMDSVPVHIQRIAPGAETHLMLQSDPRFNDIFKLIYTTDYPDKREDFRKPFQATLIGGRPAIIFTPNDYGCDWEVSSPPTAMNPLGNPAHDPPSAKVQHWREQVYQICINWLFYTLTH